MSFCLHPGAIVDPRLKCFDASLAVARVGVVRSLSWREEVQSWESLDVKPFADGFTMGACTVDASYIDLISVSSVELIPVRRQFLAVWAPRRVKFQEPGQRSDQHLSLIVADGAPVVSRVDFWRIPVHVPALEVHFLIN